MATILIIFSSLLPKCQSVRQYRFFKLRYCTDCNVYLYCWQCQKSELNWVFSSNGAWLWILLLVHSLPMPALLLLLIIFLLLFSVVFVVSRRVVSRSPFLYYYTDGTETLSDSIFALFANQTALLDSLVCYDFFYCFFLLFSLF